MMNTGITRLRTALIRGAGVATVITLVTSLVACSGGVGAVDSTSATTAAGKFVEATSGEVHLYTWSDYFPDSLAKEFKKDTGITLSIDYFDSNETLQGKLQATGGSGYDVVVPSDYMVKMLADEGLLLGFDATSLPNYENIESSFRKPYYDKKNAYSVPYMYGTTGFAYDSSKIDAADAPTSWKDFFNPPSSAGPIQLLADQTDVINAALRSIGAEPCTSDPSELQAVQDLLTKFKSKVGVISSDNIVDRLSAGEEAMGMIWNGDAHRVKENLSSMVYVYPEEGITRFEDNLVIPSGAKNVDQAKTFINWMLEPEHMAEASNYTGFNSGITGVAELLSDSMKNDTAIVPPADYDKAEVVPTCSNDVVNKYTKIWESFKS
ncbi:MAG: extracellular solute-binding protein [Bifidobacterium sp.]|jgi:spermidine/putrescine transport system substrate-binding protein|nr:extracellular solute-binding protein [Bifidobacterium sp.]MCH4175183.1 extracellular solute-binding protein [Bifidobacterium sp.]